MEAIMKYDTVVDDKITNRQEAMLVLEIAKGQMSQITSDDLRMFGELEEHIKRSFPAELELRKRFPVGSVSTSPSVCRRVKPPFDGILSACDRHRQYLELKKQFSQ